MPARGAERPQEPRPGWGWQYKCGPAPVRPPGGILAALRFGWNVLAPIQLPRATTQQAQHEQQLPEQR